VAHSLAKHAPQVRRLRIQQRLKEGVIKEEDVRKQEFNSALPLLPPLVCAALQSYRGAY
jgi:hypothetical protein